MSKTWHCVIATQVIVRLTNSGADRGSATDVTRSYVLSASGRVHAQLRCWHSGKSRWSKQTTPNTSGSMTLWQCTDVFHLLLSSPTVYKVSMSSSWHRKYQLLAWFLLVTSDALTVTIAPDALSSHGFDSSRQTYFTGFDVDVESSQFDGKTTREIFDSSRGLQHIVSRKERIKQSLLTGLFYLILWQNIVLHIVTWKYLHHSTLGLMSICMALQTLDL